MTSPHTVRDFVHWVEAEFENTSLFFGHGTDNALDEAAWLISAAIAIAPHDLDEYANKAVDEATAERIRTLVHKRTATRIPLAYLVHEAWFAGHRYYVDQRVLIPRSLTGEYILEHFQPWISENRVNDVLDLCTGCGCIAIAVALEFPGARVDATDISLEALVVAQRNVRDYGLADRVTVHQSDVFDNLGGRQYDVIISNPPYVPPSSMTTLPLEYRHEPELALVAQAGGLAIVERILVQAARYLRPGGILMVEVGESRPALERRFPDIPFTWLAHASGEDSVFLLKKSDLPSL